MLIRSASPKRAYLDLRVETTGEQSILSQDEEGMSGKDGKEGEKSVSRAGEHIKKSVVSCCA